MQEYSEGSAMELYKVATFPAHLVHQPYTSVARYLYDEHRAILIALGECSHAATQGTGISLAPINEVSVTPMPWPQVMPYNVILANAGHTCSLLTL